MPIGRPLTLRARVRRAIGLIVVVALLLFGVPLAVVLNRLIESTALAGLQRDATRGVAAVPDNVLQASSSVVAPPSVGDTRVGVYDATGTRVGGIGPAHSDLAARASDGREHDGHDAGALSVVVPVLSDSAVAGSVRAAIPLATLRARTYRAWGLLALLALLVVAIAAMFARAAARRISQPFESITAAARDLGAGRYDIGLPRWGIAEADAAGDALRESAAAIDTLVQHERDFVQHASHQLRTPLAGALLHLDRQHPDVPAALERIHHLETTIADLLSLRTVTGAGSSDARSVAAEAVTRWRASNRSVVLRSADEVADTALSPQALRQALDVLLDNAFRHGQGEVIVTVEPYGDAIIVEVSDQGPGLREDSEPGTGLRLVAGIVERAGGSLLIRRRAPHPRVALLLPQASNHVAATEPAVIQPTSNR